MSYLNSVTIIGFVGADPEQRQARNNGSKFSVLSVATQRSWKNTDDEWASKTEWHRVCVFHPLSIAQGGTCPSEAEGACWFSDALSARLCLGFRHHQTRRPRERPMLQEPPSGLLKPGSAFVHAIHVSVATNHQELARHQRGEERFHVRGIGPEIGK